MAEFQAKIYICDRCGKTETIKKIDETYVDDGEGNSVWKDMYEDSMDEWRYIWGRFLCEDCAFAFIRMAEEFMKMPEETEEARRPLDSGDKGRTVDE